MSKKGWAVIKTVDRVDRVEKGLPDITQELSYEDKMKEREESRQRKMLEEYDLRKRMQPSNSFGVNVGLALLSAVAKSLDSSP